MKDNGKLRWRAILLWRTRLVDLYIHIADPSQYAKGILLEDASSSYLPWMQFLSYLILQQGEAMVIWIASITKYQMWPSLQGSNRFLNLLQLYLVNWVIIMTNNHISSACEKKMLISKLFAILPEYLELSIFLVSDIQQFWNYKYLYI